MEEWYPYKRLREIRDPKSYGGLIFIPKNVGASEWPLLVYLHGAGEVGDDLDMLLGEGATGTPLRAIEKDEDYPKELLKFIVVGPQAQMNWNAKRLKKFLDFVLMCMPNADPSQIFVTGHSMGGAGALNAASALEDVFAAVVPVAPAGAPAPDRIHEHRIPVWAFHGRNDVIVESAISERFVSGLRDLGAAPDDARLTLYDNAPTPPGWPTCVGHASTIPAYRSPELYAWLLTKRRNVPSPSDDEPTARVDAPTTAAATPKTKTTATVAVEKTSDDHQLPYHPKNLLHDSALAKKGFLRRDSTGGRRNSKAGHLSSPETSSPEKKNNNNQDQQPPAEGVFRPPPDNGDDFA
eukprot:CAMPEP_0198674844 /NCGR_PEP_ID=MMETSP1467-20131203/98120_1 /TAXON_ID=1462469 /ORGANISM="unid. sp., Strain CCMP2135" /LENGTH=350 /DNA_ID=CAMNT_0044411745 /DNA_START=106 /DNA_END=1158 /DNA_ORIENTATION=-